MSYIDKWLQNATQYAVVTPLLISKASYTCFNDQAPRNFLPPSTLKLTWQTGSQGGIEPRYLSIYLSVCLSVRPSVRPSVCLSVSLSPYLSIYPSIHPSLDLSLSLSIYLPIYLSVYLSICLSVYLSICLSVYLSICLSVYLSICLSVYLSIFLSIYVHNLPKYIPMISHIADVHVEATSPTRPKAAFSRAAPHQSWGALRNRPYSSHSVVDQHVGSMNRCIIPYMGGYMFSIYIYCNPVMIHHTYIVYIYIRIYIYIPYIYIYTYIYIYIYTHIYIYDYIRIYHIPYPFSHMHGLTISIYQFVSHIRDKGITTKYIRYDNE